MNITHFTAETISLAACAGIKTARLAAPIKFLSVVIKLSRNNIAVFNQMFFTDEAWFHLDGFINAQNYRICSSEKPQEYRETGLHPKKLCVWCAVSRRRIVGPIFLNVLLLPKSIVELSCNSFHCWSLTNAIAFFSKTERQLILLKRQLRFSRTSLAIASFRIHYGQPAVRI